MRRVASNRGFSVALIFMLTLLLGCGRKPTAEVRPPRTETEQPRTVMRIGVVPAVSVIKTIERYQPLMSYLSKKLNMKAQIVPLKDYGSIIEQMKSGDLEAGIHGSFSAYVVQKRIEAIPIARPEKDGVSTYEGYIFTRRDSGIKSIADLKGKSFVYVSTKTSAGYLYPVYLLKASGYDPKTFFGRSSFVDRQDLAVLAVLNGDAQAGAAKNTTYNELAKENPRINKEMIILTTSSVKFPEQAFVVQKSLDPSLAGKLKRVLLDMDKNPEGKEVLNKLKADRYIESPPSDWTEIDKMAKISGVPVE